MQRRWYIIGKSKIISIICIIVIILSIGTYFTVKYFLDKDVEELVNEYGTISKENVATLVSKFNTEVMNNGLEYPASDEYSYDENNIYWYGLYEDIYLYFEPLEYSGDKEKDIVDMTAINFPKDSENQDMALQFAKCLIKANNSELTETEIDELIEEAKRASKDKLVANNGKGITVAFAEGETTYEYQIVRLYEETE